MKADINCYDEEAAASAGSSYYISGWGSGAVVECSCS